MPGLISLLALVTVLIPGATYASVILRSRPGEPLTQTSARVLIAGILCLSVPLFALAVVGEFLEVPLTEPEDLVGPAGARYTATNTLALVNTLVLVVLTSVACAYGAGSLVARRPDRWGPGHHPDVSVWWRLFGVDRRAFGGDAFVVIRLKDSSKVGGLLKNWTTERDGTEREIVLQPWRDVAWAKGRGREMEDLAAADGRAIEWLHRVVVRESEMAAIFIRFAPTADDVRAAKRIDAWASGFRKGHGTPVWAMEGDGNRTYTVDGRRVVAINRRAHRIEVRLDWLGRTKRTLVWDELLSDPPLISRGRRRAISIPCARLAEVPGLEECLTLCALRGGVVGLDRGREKDQGDPHVSPTASRTVSDGA